MNRGDNWKRLLTDKGWLVENIIRGKEGETLRIMIRSSGQNKLATYDSALIMPEYDMLCVEEADGSILFHWEDIVQIKVEYDKKKRGWF